MAEHVEGEPWGEAESELFIEFGKYYVPEREAQLATICGVVPPADGAVRIVDLCCGAGLLSHALLETFPKARVHAFDGSAAMLAETRATLAPFGDRFETHQFDIFADDWRRFPWPVHAVVSSLAVHHLDGAQKLALFRDMAAALSPGGALVIADLMEPETAEGRHVAAAAWDDGVRERSLALDGNLRAFEFFQSDNWNYYADPAPDPIDKPSSLLSQLKWFEAAGLVACDVHWMRAGHAIFSGRKPGP